MIKAIFIDIDNTLLSFDGYVKDCMEKGFAHFGLKKYEPYMFDIFTEENGKLWAQIEKNEITFDQLIEVRWPNIFKRLGIDFDGPTFETYFREFLFNSAILIDGAYGMVEYLSQKYILCLASNGPYEEQCNRMKVAQLDKFFPYYFISEKLGYSKPSKEFFEQAFIELNKEHSILPSETLIIGDSLASDIQGGINYGIHTCFFNPNKKKDIPSQIDYVIEHLSEIKNIL